MSKTYQKLIDLGILKGFIRPCFMNESGVLQPDTHLSHNLRPNEIKGAYYYPGGDEDAFDIDAIIMDKDGNVCDEIVEYVAVKDNKGKIVKDDNGRPKTTRKVIMKKDEFLNDCRDIWGLLKPGGAIGNNTLKGHHIICEKDGIDIKKSSFRYKGIPFHARGKARGLGCGIYIDGSRKYGDEVTHFGFKDNLERKRGKLPEDMHLEFSRLSHGHETEHGTPARVRREAVTKKGKKREAASSMSQTGEKIPNGMIRDDLRDIACSLIGQGIVIEDVVDVIKDINSEDTDIALTEERIDSQIVSTLSQFRDSRKIPTPFKLVRNHINMGKPNIIKETMKTLGKEYRKNTRKEGLDWRDVDAEGKPASDWKTEDITDVRDHHTVDAQNNTRHSLQIIPRRNSKGEYAGVTVKTKEFRFSEIDINRTFKHIMLENQFDPLMEWIDAEYPKYRDLLHGEYEKYGREGVVRHWKTFNAHFDILGFKKTPDITDTRFIECVHEYNQWLIYVIIAPAIHNTIMPEPSEFPVATMIGANGCFKSSLPRYLLPKKFRADHFGKATFKMDAPNLGRLFAESIFVEFPEMVGFHIDSDQTKMVVSEIRDNWTKKFKEGCEKVYRQCSWMLSNNRPRPLAYDPDNQRRYFPDYMYRHPDVVARGKREGIQTGGYVKYLEEWADEHRTRIWMEIYYLVKEQDWGLGLPNHIDELRIKYVHAACGYLDINQQVVDAFEYYANTPRDGEAHTALNYDMIYKMLDLKDRKRTTKIDDTIKAVYARMSGGHTMVKGRHELLSDNGTEHKNQLHFDVNKIREHSPANDDHGKRDGARYNFDEPTNDEIDEAINEHNAVAELDREDMETEKMYQFKKQETRIEEIRRRCRNMKLNFH